MFNNLRDKIQLVQQDLSSSLSFLDFAISGNNKSGGVSGDCPAEPSKIVSIPKTKFTYDPDVNLNAGVDLILYFQNHWTDIQCLTELNVQQWKLAQENLKDLNSKVHHYETCLRKLDEEIETLTPKIEQSFAEIEHELSESMDLLDKLNDAITELKQHKIHSEFATRKKESKKKLVQMMVRRSEDLALYENQLYFKHEQQKSQMLRERQAVFQQVFEEELKIYKEKKGMVLIEPSQSLIAGNHNDNHDDHKPKLEDISLEIGDDDVQKLEQFLMNDDD